MPCPRPRRGARRPVRAGLRDDAESIITNERYDNITEVCDACVRKSPKTMTTTQKIDRVVTNRILGIPIFIVIMFLVYYISVSTVGTIVTDWANDGLFGDGWHLLGIGSKAYNEVNDEYTASLQAVEAFLGIEIDTEADDFDPSAVTAQMNGFTASSNATATVDVEDEETLAINTMTAYYDTIPEVPTRTAPWVSPMWTPWPTSTRTALTPPIPPTTACGSRRACSGGERSGVCRRSRLAQRLMP